MVYEPYGKETTIVGSVTGDFNFLYQGGRFDPITQTYQFGARVYAPSIGTWVQKDPAGYVDGNDLYQFIDSNPACSVDPSGLAPPKCNCRSIQVTFDPDRGWNYEVAQENHRNIYLVGFNINVVWTFTGNKNNVVLGYNESGSLTTTHPHGNFEYSTFANDHPPVTGVDHSSNGKGDADRDFANTINYPKGGGMATLTDPLRARVDNRGKGSVDIILQDYVLVVTCKGKDDGKIMKKTYNISGTVTFTLTDTSSAPPALKGSVNIKEVVEKE
jgi:RHS repeat-associated protein